MATFRADAPADMSADPDEVWGVRCDYCPVEFAADELAGGLARRRARDSEGWRTAHGSTSVDWCGECPDGAEAFDAFRERGTVISAPRGPQVARPLVVAPELAMAMADAEAEAMGGPDV